MTKHDCICNGGPQGYSTWICPICGQYWWCYNDYYNLWTTVDDEATWRNVQMGCPEAVVIGSPATMVSYLKEVPISE